MFLASSLCGFGRTWGMMGRKLGVCGKSGYKNLMQRIGQKHNRLYHFLFKGTICKNEIRPLPPPKTDFPIYRLYLFPTPGAVFKAFWSSFARRTAYSGRRGRRGERLIGGRDVCGTREITGEDELGTHFWQGPLACAICGHQWRGVVEIAIAHDTPIVPLECPDCGNMTGHVVSGCVGTGHVVSGCVGGTDV